MFTRSGKSHIIVHHFESRAGIGFAVEFYSLTRVKRKFSPVHTDYRQDQVGLPELQNIRVS